MQCLSAFGMKKTFVVNEKKTKLISLLCFRALGYKTGVLISIVDSKQNPNISHVVDTVFPPVYTV